MIFPIKLFIYCKDNKIFEGGGGGEKLDIFLGGEASTPQIP